MPSILFFLGATGRAERIKPDQFLCRLIDRVTELDRGRNPAMRLAVGRDEAGRIRRGEMTLADDDLAIFDGLLSSRYPLFALKRLTSFLTIRPLACSEFGFVQIQGCLLYTSRCV